MDKPNRALPIRLDPNGALGAAQSIFVERILGVVLMVGLEKCYIKQCS